MKYLIILIVLLTSCSSDWHIRRAKFKQPNILQQYNDTITLRNVRIDTVYYADTFAVVHTLTEYDTIIQTRYLKPETRYEIRYRYKTITDTVKERERTARIETRQDNRTERTNARQENRTERTKSRRLWWLWLIVGFVGGIFTCRWLKSIF